MSTHDFPSIRITFHGSCERCKKFIQITEDLSRREQIEPAWVGEKTYRSYVKLLEHKCEGVVIDPVPRQTAPSAPQSSEPPGEGASPRGGEKGQHARPSEAGEGAEGGSNAAGKRR